METIALIDTSICSDNLGDEIIMDAVNETIEGLFPSAYIVRVPSHEALSERTRKFVLDASYCFIGGTNLLSSNITPTGLWRLDRAAADAYGSTRTVCLGTGWIDYKPAVAPRTRKLLQTALSGTLTHSVRDTYTKAHLENVGLKVLSTSCPTTWSLTPDHCANFPHSRASAAILTLTAWRADIESDRRIIDLLRRQYRKIYFFPQMQEDYNYFRSFGFDDIKMLGTTLNAYNKFLENEDVDFVGTRLHGGIRALQRRRRALILAVDNRATEIGRDIGLPVLQRTDVRGIESWLEGADQISLRLPEVEIEKWKSQFREVSQDSNGVSPGFLNNASQSPSVGRKIRTLLDRFSQRL